MVQPVGLYFAGVGSAGRVDIYGSTLNEVLLTNFDDGWLVLDANRVELTPRFDKPTFDRLADALTATV